MKRIAFNAGQIVVLGFFLGNVVGTTLLMLPISSSKAGATDLLQASFTSVSALSLTGMSVVDTSSHWSFFGQAVIATLVQVGGFGIMALGSLIGMLLTQKLSFKTKLTTTAEQSALGLRDFRHLVFRVFQISIAIEAMLAVTLALRFHLSYNQPLAEAIWNGVFHSITAFNNAGFSILPGGLTSFSSDWVVLLPIAAASIAGALGFPVLFELARKFVKRLRDRKSSAPRVSAPLTLHTRLVLSFSAALLLLGSVYTLVIEWANNATLGRMGLGEKLLNAFFASAMARTTGFNTLDYGQMHSETLAGTDLLMFIGGGSAGTSGGIRITTFAVLVLLVVAEIRGRQSIEVGRRTIPASAQRTAVALSMLSFFWVLGFVTLLQLITDFGTDQILFEALSAFGTVGLSTGITAQLPPVAQVMLMVMMFVGRIGLILVASTFAKGFKPKHFSYPEERLLIG
ncbi:MAG: hypothetical protein RL719_1104 [Actinomycetota bacterium]|jgi:potassium uptake TrkH family protein